MLDADARSLATRTRFLKNEQLLSTVRAQALLSSVYVRDALLDTSGTQTQFYRDQLQRIRTGVEQALGEYVPRANSTVERANWAQLTRELGDYWDSLTPMIAPEHTLTSAGSQAYLRDHVIPRRETVIRISDQIHALNQEAFEAELTELGQMRSGLRSRIWLTSIIAAAFGLAIAAFAASGVRRLDARIRDQHAHEVEQRGELVRLSSRLLQVQEDERRRIARELHDEVGQALSALKLELAVAAPHGTAALADESLAEARAITDRALQAVRDLSQGLHPAMLDDLGLPETADWYLRAFSRRTGIASELSVDRFDTRLAPEIEICAYRVIQEAVTNVARHAAATSCRVQIVCAPASLHVLVEDNGRGFQPTVSRAPDNRGLGLVGLRERVAGLGGALHVDSRPGAGTQLAVELPLAGEP